MKVLRPATSLGFAIATLLAACAISLGSPNRAHAQTVGVCDPANPSRCVKPDASGNMPVTGTLTATSGAFVPSGVTTKITAGNGSSVSGALSATGPDVIVDNEGAVPEWVTFGVGSATAAVGTSYYIPAGNKCTIHTAANTFAAAFGVGGTADTYLTPGTGSAGCWGGGGTSAGGGLSVTDTGAFTGASSLFTPYGCFFQTTATNNPLTNLTQGTIQCTANRAQFVNMRDASGAEEGTTGNPLQVTLANTGVNANKLAVNVSQFAGGTAAQSHGTAANALRVELPTDGTGVVFVKPQDSGGGDATDTVNHAVKVNVVAGATGGGAIYPGIPAGATKNVVTCSATTTTPVACGSAPGVGKSIHIKGWQCNNLSAVSPMQVLFNDTASTATGLPSNGPGIPVTEFGPLDIATNTAPTIAPSVTPTSGSVGCTLDTYITTP